MNRKLTGNTKGFVDIVTIFILLFALLGSAIFGGMFINSDEEQDGGEHSNLLFTYENSPHDLPIKLNLTGTAYGQELLWKANTTGTNYEESSVIYFDGVAYIGSCSTHGDGHDSIFAVNSTNGDILWSTHIGPGYVGPVVDNDRIYIGTSSHGYDPTNEYMYCINRTDGSIIWSRNIFGGIPESIQYDEENIYFTSNLIYALDKYDGSIKWTYQMDSFSVTKPILKDNTFITATSEGRMYKVNVSTGNLLWNVPLSAATWDNSITADDKGHLFLAIYEIGTMNAYNEETGDLLWTYQLRDRTLSFNAYHNNMVFIADMSGYVYAINATSGNLIWENKIGDKFDISSPTISGGLLFIGTRDFDEGAFYALNETNGEVVWKYKIGNCITAPPTIVDGMLLCGTDDWHMYAFDIGIGSGDWLLSRYDSYNTANTPVGLQKWQYVSATCITEENTTICSVTNTYDHKVLQVKLQLPEGIDANWYNASGHLLRSSSNYLLIDDIDAQNTKIITISLNKINPPSKPIISGPTSGRIQMSYNYTISSNDQTNENLFYYVDWGDDSSSGWLGPYSYNEECIIFHKWITRGNFQIKAKAKYSNNIESDWSDPLSVSMPKNKGISLFNFDLNRLIELFPILENLL